MCPWMRPESSRLARAFANFIGFRRHPEFRVAEGFHNGRVCA